MELDLVCLKILLCQFMSCGYNFPTLCRLFIQVIILIIPRDELRKYMLRAHAMGMTSGDYQFLYTEVTLADQKDEEFINSDKLWRVGDTDDEAAHQAFENVLYVRTVHSN